MLWAPELEGKPRGALRPLAVGCHQPGAPHCRDLSGLTSGRTAPTPTHTHLSLCPSHHATTQCTPRPPWPGCPVSSVLSALFRPATHFFQGSPGDPVGTAPGLPRLPAIPPDSSTRQGPAPPRVSVLSQTLAPAAPAPPWPSVLREWHGHDGLSHPKPPPASPWSWCQNMEILVFPWHVLAPEHKLWGRCPVSPACPSPEPRLVSCSY